MSETMNMEYWFSPQAWKEETCLQHKSLCSVYLTKKTVFLLPSVVLSLPWCLKLSSEFCSYKGCLSKLKPHFEWKFLKWPLKLLAVAKLHPVSGHIWEVPYPSLEKSSHCFFCGLRKESCWDSFFLYSCSINMAWTRLVSQEAWVEEKHVMNDSGSSTSFCKSENYLSFAWFSRNQKDRIIKQAKILSRVQNSFSRLVRTMFGESSGFLQKACSSSLQGLMAAPAGEPSSLISLYRVYIIIWPLGAKYGKSE